MIVVSAAGSDERLNLGTRDACEVVNSIGTDSYGDVCFAMLERALNAEHWALFRFRSGSPLKCVATASKRDKAAAKENCERFVGHCYSVDPSVKVASTRLSAPTLTKMAIDDIEDPQYRQCFELTHVQERVSIFRGPRKASFSALEMNHFAALAKLLLATAQKHEMLVDQQTSFPRHLNIEGIERLLKLRSPELSTRECEVCARAVAGKTIEGTSLDLDIKRTSVITYRQRAYQKLGISRTNELVALLSNLHAERSLAS